jgi:hypothetical protein
VENGNDNILPVSHDILNIRQSFFYQLLNFHAGNDVGQTEMHTAEPLLPEPRSFEV